MAFVNFTWPGVNQGTRFHLSTGYGQNVIFVGDIIPQPWLPAVDGILSITDGTNVVSIPGCRLDEAHLTRSIHGHFCRIQILGPTWKWRLASIDGVYNVRGTDGNIVGYTRKTVRELATLLFQAMLVPAYDVSGLPNAEGPTVNWRGTNCFEALTYLCHEWGCDFGLDINGSVARVWRLGVGPVLPSGGLDVTQDYGIELAKPPDRLRVNCNTTLYQSKLKLRAVMEDTDGSLVAPDDVSYNPQGQGTADGWLGRDPFDPLGPDADPEARRLAKKTYLRYFLIESQADGTQEVPGYGEVGGVEDILPVFDFLAEDFQVDDDNYRKQAYLQGVFAFDDKSLRNTDSDELLEVPFTIDKEKGLVILSLPVYQHDDQLRQKAPELYLVTSYRVREAQRFQYAYHSQSRVLANNGTGELVINRSDLVRRVIATYDGNEVDSIQANDTQLNLEINAQLDAAQAEFLPKQSLVKTYIGVLPFSLSGTIQQVAWFGGTHQDCYTIASMNTEWEPGLMRRRQRRLAAENERRRVEREIDELDRRRLHRKGVL